MGLPQEAPGSHVQHAGSDGLGALPKRRAEPGHRFSGLGLQSWEGTSIYFGANKLWRCLPQHPIVPPLGSPSS